MQLPLAGLADWLEGNPPPPKSSVLQGETASSEAARKKSEYNRAYRQAHANELAEYNRKWKKANPDKVKAKQDRYYEKNHERILAKERERWHEKHGPTKRVFGRSDEEKAALTKQRQHEYYLANGEKLRADAKRRRDEHPEDNKQKCRERYASMTIEERRAEQQQARANRLSKDPDCDRRRNRERYKNDPEHREKILAANKQWIADNREKYLGIVSEWRRKKCQSDPVFKLRCLMGTRIHEALKGELKRETTVALLGCTREEFKAHLESKWAPGMSWSNLGSGEGTWQIDHINPVSNYDLSTLEGQRAAFHYSNTQALWYEDHLKKSASEETGWRRRADCTQRAGASTASGTPTVSIASPATPSTAPQQPELPMPGN